MASGAISPLPAMRSRKDWEVLRIVISKSPPLTSRVTEIAVAAVVCVTGDTTVLVIH